MNGLFSPSSLKSNYWCVWFMRSTGQKLVYLGNEQKYRISTSYLHYSYFLNTIIEEHTLQNCFTVLLKLREKFGIHAFLPSMKNGMFTCNSMIMITDHMAQWLVFECSMKFKTKRCNNQTNLKKKRDRKNSSNLE